ncbi:hypothetical protein [Natronomonas gomsonensis]|uniref:hypothetical protein n=1 Tax=Natronomonas gomsonensis TaxID=1046043 RepID=UPI0015BF2D95|nr:hypothetical protein [Natronomonas gomsonensis]
MNTPPSIGARERRWSRRAILKRTSALTATGLTVALAGCSILGADHATYWSDSGQLDVDYDGVMAAAREAGYEVEEPYYVNDTETRGVHPDGLTDLDERFGPDYRVFGFSRYHTETVFLEVSLTGEQPSMGLFDDRGAFEGIPVDSVPPEAWLIEQFTLVFDVFETDAREYAAALREQAAEGTDTPRVEVSEPLDFPGFYGAVESERTDVLGSETGGDGWYNETSLRDGQRFATVAFIVQSMAVIHHDGSRRYRLKLDRLGGFNLEVRLPVGEEIPEEEYRGVFRQLFEDVGLPPETVDDLTFEYSPSVW